MQSLLQFGVEASCFCCDCLLYRVGPRDLFPMSAHETHETCFHVDPRDLFFHVDPRDPRGPRDSHVDPRDLFSHVGPRDLFSMSTHETCFPCRQARPARLAFHVDPPDLFFHVDPRDPRGSRDSHVGPRDWFFHVGPRDPRGQRDSHVGPQDLFSMSAHETCFPCRPTRRVSHVGPRDPRDLCFHVDPRDLFPISTHETFSHVGPRDLFLMLPPNFDTPLISTRHV